MLVDSQQVGQGIATRAATHIARHPLSRNPSHIGRHLSRGKSVGASADDYVAGNAIIQVRTEDR